MGFLCEPAPEVDEATANQRASMAAPGAWVAGDGIRMGYDGFSHCSSYPTGSMYGIYGNIYHQYTPMLLYIPYMDSMGMG